MQFADQALLAMQSDFRVGSHSTSSAVEPASILLVSKPSTRRQNPENVRHTASPNTPKSQMTLHIAAFGTVRHCSL